MEEEEREGSVVWGRDEGSCIVVLRGRSGVVLKCGGGMRGGVV